MLYKMNKNMEKRGQITVFIIVGIILLLSAAIYIAVSKELNIFSPREIIPPELEPLKTYVETCLKDAAEPGINLLGLQGGYIEIPQEIALDSDRHLALIPKMTASKKIPYWYYDNLPRIPTRIFMEEQLTNFLEQRLSQCTNLESFETSFDIKELLAPRILVQINLDDISIELIYPLEITNKANNQLTKLSRFTTTIPVRLGRMHELATKIMREENTNVFLEQLTMDMIATANTDNGRFPYEGTEITCSSRIWSIENQLKPDLQKILQYNLHFLKFKGTKTIPMVPGVYYLETDTERLDLYDELSNYYYNRRLQPPLQTSEGVYPPRSEYELSYNINLGDEQYPDIMVSTIYDETYGMSMKVYPSNGDSVSAMKMPIPLIGSCIKLYHHFYTIKYPVLFMLTDSKNPYKPFVFNFATPVIIDKNSPMRQKDYSIVDDSFRTITSEDYCSRQDYMLPVYATDEWRGGYLDGVYVSYQCLGYVCELGTIKKPIVDNIPIGDPLLKTYFPTCINGQIIAKKQGYLDYTKTVSIEPGNTEMPTSVTMELTPLKKLEYEFRVVELSEGALVGLVPRVRPVDSQETVFLTLQNKEKNYELNLISPTEFDLYKNLMLINGDYSYDLSIKLMKDEQLIGGYEILGWKVTRNELVSANRIIFYLIVKVPTPTDPEEMGKVWVDLIQEESKKDIYKPKIR